MAIREAEIVTSFDGIIVDVGFIHLDSGREAETAEWVAFQLSQINYSTQLYPYGVTVSWDELEAHLGMVKAGVRFTAILFSHDTPELMGLATSMIVQGNSDWILPMRCEDCPQNPMLANLPHFDIFGVENGVGDATTLPVLTSMAQYMQAVLSQMQDPPQESFDSRPHFRQRWEGPC